MRTLMIAFTTISDPSREEEFNTWYDTVHAPESMQIPGVISCRRYKLSDTQAMASGLAQFLAIYEVEPEAVESVPKHLAELAGAGKISTIEIMSGGTMALYEPLSQPEA